MIFKLSNKKKVKKKCILVSRLDNATRIELERISGFLGLKPTSNTSQIINEYKSAAGNSFVNVARKIGFADDVTYRQILIDVIEKIRPLETDIKEYSDKLVSIFSSISGKAPTKDKTLCITDLEMTILQITRSKLEKKCKDNPEENQNEIGKSGYTSTQKVMGTSAVSAGIGIGSAVASRGALLLVGGTIASVAATVLIPAALSTPAYRKTINVTIELIIIGLRQLAEEEFL